MLHSRSENPHGFTVRISDFGFSRLSNNEYPEGDFVTGNWPYSAPEVLRGQPCTEVRD